VKCCQPSPTRSAIGRFEYSRITYCFSGFAALYGAGVALVDGGGPAAATTTTGNCTGSRKKWQGEEQEHEEGGDTSEHLV
jgi:hypothetical protein